MDKRKAVLALRRVGDTLKGLPVRVAFGLLHCRAYHTPLIVERVFGFFSKRKGFDALVLDWLKETNRGVRETKMEVLKEER